MGKNRRPQSKSKPSPASKARRPVKSSPKLPDITDADHRAFRKNLVEWYEHAKRDLPWRRTRDPYAIAVSELMLQQTQVTTVLPYYDRWLKKFPTWVKLARAPEDQVLKAWEGLGYYRRARNLQKLARAVSESPDQNLPNNLNELLALPGIGPYTAAAIGSIAFDLPAAVVDGNVMRVLTRVFNLRDDITKSAVQKSLAILANQLAPKRDCGTYNQAVMELGALVCTPRKPQCLICPLQAVCQAPDPEQLPVKTRIQAVEIEETIAVIQKQNRWWLERPEEGQRLDAMWRFPHFDEATMIASDNGNTAITSFTYGITKYRVRLRAIAANWKPRKTPPLTERRQWMPADAVENAALASAHRRIWKAILKD